MAGTGILSVTAFHEKAGRSQVGCFVFSFNKVCFSRRVATVAMLPSALSRSDSFRSVHVGRSRFSRCCYLFWRPVVLLSQSGTWARPLTQSPELGFGLFDFSLPGTILTLFCLFVLCGCRHCRSAAVVERFVQFSAHPQMMQQHCQLSCGRHDGSLLPAISATFGQFQAPAPEIAVHPERTQNVLGALHQQRAQIRIAFLADVQLRLALTRVSSSREGGLAPPSPGWTPGTLALCYSPLCWDGARLEYEISSCRPPPSGLACIARDSDTNLDAPDH